MIETTVNITKEMREAVRRAARLAGVTQSVLIAAVMKRLMMDHQRLVRDGRRVEYQKTGDSEWKRLHVAIEFRDYEFFIDMRKMCRRSVSFLVKIAVDKYLDEVIASINRDDYNEEADNYPFLHYILLYKTVPGAVCWTIYWGMPENQHLLLDQIPEIA